MSLLSRLALSLQCLLLQGAWTPMVWKPDVHQEGRQITEVELVKAQRPKPHLLPIIRGRIMEAIFGHDFRQVTGKRGNG